MGRPFPSPGAWGMPVALRRQTINDGVAGRLEWLMDASPALAD